MTTSRHAADPISTNLPTATASPYSRFARAYAAGEERTFSQAMASYALAQATVGGGRACRTVLDVACGIGAACEFFAGTGLQVSGADMSRHMIQQARDAASAKGLTVTYAQQDMRRVTVPEPADLVTCMYDSLNFMLTESDLLTAFTAARTCVQADGAYVFDVYSPHGLAAAWGPEDQVHTVTDDHFVATRTTRNELDGTHTKYFWGFDRDDRRWAAWTEAHTLRAYEFPVIRDLLTLAGFSVAGAAGWAGHRPVPWSDANERWVITARPQERILDQQEES